MEGFTKKEQSEIKAGTHGYGVQFVYEYALELNKLNHAIIDGYDRIYAKFNNLYNDLIKTTSTNANNKTSHELIGENDK